MDVLLEACDTYFLDAVYAALLPALGAPFNLQDGMDNGTAFDPSASPWQYKPATGFFGFPPTEAAYMSAWTRDNLYRITLSVFLITLIGCGSFYFAISSLSYAFIFDKGTFNHPKYLKNQVRQEIKQAVNAMPGIAVLTTPFFVAEILGYSKLYDSPADEPFKYYNWLQVPAFILFTDFCIYFIHRGLHHPLIYKTLHKPHHKWIMPTPYASVAFHPVDGWIQSVPYHLFAFLFPLQKFVYLGLYLFVQVWTVMIHDGEYVANSEILNGAACHTMHHLYFNYNYGQYTTLWDRLGGSYRAPNAELFTRESKMGEKEWKRQVAEMEIVQKEVEGEDDRTYDDRRSTKKLN